MSNYEPELGQMAFGVSWGKYEVPEIWSAALLKLREELDRVMWNKNQQDYDSPFDNTGNKFSCDVFQVQAYNWNDIEDEEGHLLSANTWNFKWRDIEISWYKYFTRGLSSNKELTVDLAGEMLKECLEALGE
jgi:hypothetical protein|tara:strand:- start:1721 stop:2116 length:396 start_codon:yes stop_codon:yes gene_type:complete